MMHVAILLQSLNIIGRATGRCEEYQIEIRCLAVGKALMNSTVPCKLSRWVENR
jgi:hypothetical protein